MSDFHFWQQQDSNPRPGHCYADVLPLRYFDPPSKKRFKPPIERVATPGGELRILDDLLTPCAVTLRTIAFTLHRTGD